MTSKSKPARDDHEHTDGCLCGVEIHEHELTPDHELPETKGGLAKPKRTRATRTSVGEKED